MKSRGFGELTTRVHPLREKIRLETDVAAGFWQIAIDLDTASLSFIAARTAFEVTA